MLIQVHKASLLLYKYSYHYLQYNKYRYYLLQNIEFYHNKWGLYKNMVRGKSKLPSSDQWQNIIEYSTSLLPKKDRYYNYFGTLGVPDTTFF